MIKGPKDKRQGWLFDGGAGVAATAPPSQLQFDLPSRGIVKEARLRFEVFQTQEGKTMSDEYTEFPKEAAEKLGHRWRSALVQRYPRAHRAKNIARDFDVSVRTAKSWLDGGCPPAPQAANLGRAAHLFGLKILAEVLLPDSKWLGAANVDEKLADVQSRLRVLQDEIVLLREVE